MIYLQPKRHLTTPPSPSLHLHLLHIIILIQLQRVNRVINGVGAAGADGGCSCHIIRRSQRIPWLLRAPGSSHRHLLLVQLLHLIHDLFLNIVIRGHLVVIILGMQARLLLLVQFLLLLHQWTRGAIAACLGVLTLHRIILIPLRLKRDFGRLLQLLNLRLHLLDLVLLGAELLGHLDKDGVVVLRHLQIDSLEQIRLLLRNLNILSLLESHLWQVHRLRIVHLEVLEVLPDQVSHQQCILVAVNLFDIRILPLKARLLLRPLISIALNGHENTGAQLSLQVRECAFPLKGLDHN